MYFLYKLLTYLFYPFASTYLRIRKLKNKEDKVRYIEKLSKINIKRNEGFLIWFHVASVGEAMSILPLIENCIENEKISTILITSITLSSGKILEKRYKNNTKIIHQFLPLDVPIFTKKFLNYWRPNLSIFVDSEIWPNLIYKIKEKNIPLLLVNGRITNKSFIKWNLINRYAKKIFGKFDLCIASNKETENHLKILGARNIKNYGNLKFSSSKINFNNKLSSPLLENIQSRKVWCASSTHDSEEVFCAKVHLNMKKKYKNILTIIIPRHINRVKIIEQNLKKLDLKIASYNNLNKFNENTDILLVDAFGETTKFFKILKCVFLGGSLIKHGGQNPIEPARMGCKVYHGPYIKNFSEIYSYLRDLGVAHEVNNINSLSQHLIKEFSINQENNVDVMSKIDSHGSNILDNIMKEIKSYINI